MVDMNEQANGTPRPEKPKHTPRSRLILLLAGILAVLVLANLDAILKPVKTLGTILTPIIIGLVIAYLCNPIMRFCEIKLFYKLKRRVSRALSMLFTYLFMLLIISGMALLIIPQVIDSINDFRVNGMFFLNRLITSINEFFASLPFELPGGNENVLSLEKLLTYAMQLFDDLGSNFIGSVGTFAGNAITVLKNILVGIFVSIYVLLSKDRLKAGCRRIIHALFREENEKKILYYSAQAHRKFGGFIVGKLVDSLIVGITAAIFFNVFKIPYPTLIAVIIGVTDFIPFFGPFIGAIPSAIIIFIAEPSKLLLFVVLILVIQQIDGNLLAPLILGDHTGMTSLGVLIAITVMGDLFNIVGMIIGVPLFALITIILDDMIKQRLREKGSPTGLYAYYPADSFIKPTDEDVPHYTMTQRFMHWVTAVETELETPDYKPSHLRHCVNMIRLGLLNIGKFFYRMFSSKQLKEDYHGSHVNVILRRGMRTNRTFWRSVLLTVVTLGIYPIYLIENIAADTNISCSRDGRRTWGAFPVFTLGIITLGIFPLIWHCQVICRYRHLCEQNGKECRISVKFFLLWALLGVFTLVGPMIAIARFIAAYTQSCRIFNETHTFPLARRVIKEEAAEGAAYLAARKAARKAEMEAIVGDTTIFGSIEEESDNEDQISFFETASEEATAAVEAPEATKTE